jgi:hypothetical protein
VTDLDVFWWMARSLEEKLEGAAYIQGKLGKVKTEEDTMEGRLI